MNIEEFQNLLRPVTDLVSGREAGPDLQSELNEHFPPDGTEFGAIEQACNLAVSEGWMCAQGVEGRRFGRVIEPTESTGNLSVDVVELADMVGPHHRHPAGEICMVMPMTEDALFDGVGRGWCVFEPGSEHRPTVRPGRARVLYMLPGGKIDFTGA